MLLFRSPVLVARLCSFSRVVKFLPVSLIQVAWQSEHLILLTAPGLSPGSSLPLTLLRLPLTLLTNVTLKGHTDDLLQSRYQPYYYRTDVKSPFRLNGKLCTSK